MKGTGGGEKGRLETMGRNKGRRMEVNGAEIREDRGAATVYTL